MYVISLNYIGSASCLLVVFFLKEQPDKEHVDDDEDKKNPAYVPRKGAFYEHDTRTGEEAAPEAELK